MKTKVIVTTLLIALGFATANLNGQRARETSKREATRTETKRVERKTQPVSMTTNNNSRSDYKRVEARQTTQRTQPKSTQSKSTQAKRNEVKRVEANRTQNRVATKPENNRNQPTAYKRNTNTVNNRKVSTSQDRNPSNNGTRDVYRPATRKVKTNKYSYERHIPARVNHKVYPTKKVNIHYHHGTYRNHYRVAYYPTHMNIYWNRSLYHDYRKWYPDYRWNYNYGERINSISVFDTRYFIGDVAQVYGRVYATWYNHETDDYLLFFGGDYPRQEFTLVVPGRVARKYSWRPERHFLGEHVLVTGLITTWDGSPEMVVKNKRQLKIY